jgi:hypothetical protein
MRKSKAADIALACARAADDAYRTVLEHELNTLYDAVQEDFSSFYVQSTKRNESKFTAKLTPSEGKLDFDVSRSSRSWSFRVRMTEIIRICSCPNHSASVTAFSAVFPAIGNRCAFFPCCRRYGLWCQTGLKAEARLGSKGEWCLSTPKMTRISLCMTAPRICSLDSSGRRDWICRAQSLMGAQ